MVHASVVLAWAAVGEQHETQRHPCPLPATADVNVSNIGTSSYNEDSHADSYSAVCPQPPTPQPPTHPSPHFVHRRTPAPLPRRRAPRRRPRHPACPRGQQAAEGSLRHQVCFGSSSPGAAHYYYCMSKYIASAHAHVHECIPWLSGDVRALLTIQL
jgi:hypothetical protein